ncbi:MAG: hypothetical protein WD469_12210 [Paenibacillaceae bacterium]
MSMNLYWQLLGMFLFIAVLVLIHKSSRYAEEDICPYVDIYHREEKDVWPSSLLESNLIIVDFNGGDRVRIAGTYLSPEIVKKMKPAIKKVDSKGKGDKPGGSNNKRSNGWPNAKAFNTVFSGFSTKGK